MARLITKNPLPKRGEIWIVDLRPGKGWEVSKKRPAIVISANQINSRSPLVIILPISSQIPAILGVERILLPGNSTSLKKDSLILVHQIKAIDKSRLIKKIGTLAKDKLEEVEDSLNLVLGLEASI